MCIRDSAGPDTSRYALNGKLVIPGLVDAHTHPGGMGRYARPGQLPTDTQENILAAVKEYAEANPDPEWIEMCCFPMRLYDRGLTGPDRKALDEVIPNRPVWLTSDIGHSIWVNSKALELMGVDRDDRTPDPHPGVSFYVRDEDGRATGWIKESGAAGMFITALKARRRIPGLLWLILRLPICFSTAVVSNLGNAEMRMRAELPQCESGQQAGDVVITHLVGVPPVRPGTAASVGIARYGGRLWVSCLADEQRLGVGAADRLLKAIRRECLERQAKV